MSAVTISLLTAACVFLGGLAGLFAHWLLPEQQQTKETMDVVRLGIGMLSVLSSLVLGLLIASAKGSWDTTDHALRGYAADLILLDETLRDYGNDAAAPRARLRAYTQALLTDSRKRVQHTIWTAREGTDGLEKPEAGEVLERMREEVRALQPTDAPAKWLQDQALAMQIALARERWHLIEDQGPAVRPVVLGILVSWIVVIFASFGLNAPRNLTVLVAFFVCSLAIGGSVFLILEMDSPFEGLLTISLDPIERAVAHMVPTAPAE